jgi:protein-disulfide isomerase
LAAAVAPLDDSVDHVRGARGGRVLFVYGDYECPYTRAAYRQVQRVERVLGDRFRFAYRHFPLVQIHPHALAAAAAAEAAAVQDRFWEMHDMLFRRQDALEDEDLRRYSSALGLDGARFDADRTSARVLERVGRDIESALATGQVRGTPTLFIDGRLHTSGDDAPELLKALVP